MLETDISVVVPSDTEDIDNWSSSCCDKAELERLSLSHYLACVTHSKHRGGEKSAKFTPYLFIDVTHTSQIGF